MLLTFSFCSAASEKVDENPSSSDPLTVATNVIDRLSSFWKETGQPAWEKFVVWFDKDIKPWLDKETSEETKQEFSKESQELMNTLPDKAKAVWDKVCDLINKKD